MAPLEGAVEEVQDRLRLHALHGSPYAGALRPLRAIPRGGETSAAQSLAERTAARPLRPAAGPEAADAEVMAVDEGACCSLEGCTLIVHGASAAEDFAVDLALADVGAAELPGEGLVAIAVVPAPQDEAPAAAVGWVLICRAEERDEALELLGAAGALRGDLGAACHLSSQKPLGYGGFATVHRAKSRISSGCSLWGCRPLDVAVKALSASSTRSAVANEVACLVRAQHHPNIIRFHGLYSTRGSAPGQQGVAIVLDYASGGDLFGRCAAVGSCSEREAAGILQGVLSALAHIHEVGIVHRDVKPENVLLMADGSAVLADFGVAAQVAGEGERLSLRVGSLGYAAPEVITGKRYGKAIDIFGAGGILHFAVAGVSPFEGRDKTTVMWKTCQCKLELEGKPWNKVNADCKELLRALLRRSPQERPRAAEACEHPWLLAKGAATCPKKQWAPRTEEPSRGCLLKRLWDVLHTAVMAAEAQHLS